MPTRTLGQSGLVVSRLGLGLAALGRPGYINLGHADDLAHDYAIPAMERHSHSVLDAALAAGVRYFDAARSYGRAESFLASWLAARGLPADAVTVGSKWGYTYTAGWRPDADQHEVKEHSPAVLRRQFGESLALLGSRLNLYQIHSATLESGVLDDPVVLSELDRMKTAHRLRIGLSVSGPRQTDTLRRALAVTVSGVRLFDTVQATWNVLEPSVGPTLAEAHAAGLGVIVKEALANGRLTRRNTDSAFAEQLWLLQEEAERLGTEIESLALSAVLAQPWADVVLSGAATLEQLRNNVGATAVRLDEAAERRLATLAEEPEAYWRTRAGLAWN
jgi:aryl-alcohol dehydrogenase-like predicted oxidoreductase